MARNAHFKTCDSLSLPVPAGTKAGTPVKVGALTGVTETDRAVGNLAPLTDGYNWGGGNPDGNASVRLRGSFHVEVTGALNPGDPVYITTAGALNGTATGNTLFGYALQAKGAAAGVIPVALAAQV